MEQIESPVRNGCVPVPMLWVVVPCYNEEEVLPETARRLMAKLGRLATDGRIDARSRVLLVDDGSRDATWEMIRALASGSLEGVACPAGMFCGISLAHNAGHQNALYAGLMHASDHGCDCAVSMDADLQDDIDAIDEMLGRFAEGAEVVYGVRDNRDTDTAFKRGTARAFYGLMGRLGVEMVPDSADYRLMGRRALEALSEYREANLFLRGIVPAIGFPTARVYYRRGERFAGESKYPLGRMVQFALQGITSFSVLPIRLVTALGVASVVVSVGMVVYALVSRASGDVVPGWTSLMVSVWFVGGLIMVSLGVVGEYVGMTYLESKRRPRYIIGDVVE
ncbi:MAG: glycosyltransferase family 2 protein [Coriobacteriales bacterium]|nr:glycosyltransferase family 2 protein [Coriobacteriales bacterium]